MAVLTQRRCGENPKPLYLIWSMGVIAQTCIQSCVMFSTNLILIYVNPSEIDEIIKELPCNKSPGLDGIIGEQFKHANNQLSVLLAVLVSAILVHGRVPTSMLESVMVLKKNEVILHLITYVIIHLVKRYNKQTSYFRCGRKHSIASRMVPVPGSVHYR